MSVGFVNAIVEGLRYNDVPVSFEWAYQTRGNGFSFPNGRPSGCLIHHTGVPLNTGLSVLINGRSDLAGPLCNSCGFADGRVHIIAAHPANHAGASGGRSMGPLKVTRLFNPEVWGHEIMFPGVTPMTAAQERSALVLGAVISGTLGRPSAEWVRLHHETSITGKWDAGAGTGSGVPYSGPLFRSRVWPALNPQLAEELGVNDMPANEWQIDGIPRKHKITFPVGAKVSGLIAAGWVSIEPSEAATIDVVARGLRTGQWLDQWTEKIPADKRWWKELPDGTESVTVTISSEKPGVAGWCLELRPRKGIAV